MIEKRFTILYETEENPMEWDLIDNQKDCLIVTGNGKVICDLLNELNDENQHIKKQRDCVYGDLTRLKKDYLELTDENENLKAQNKLIKMEIEEMQKMWESK